MVSAAHPHPKIPKVPPPPGGLSTPLSTFSGFILKPCTHRTGGYFCAATKILPDSASVHTYERSFPRDFCDGAKLRRADLESEESHIG